MFLPIGDEPNPRRLSVVNLALIAINAGVFLAVSLPLMLEPVDYNDPLLPEYLRLLATRAPQASLQELLQQITAYDLFVYQHGFRPADANLADLFSSLFLHGGW